MAIAVYRLYLGCTWVHAGAVEQLVRGFDAIPEFLYRLDSLPRDADDINGGDATARRSLTRIAMTQAHAILMLGGPTSASAADIAMELDLARHGFRRRLPVVEIVPAGPQVATPSVTGADVVVGFDATAIACAIQQVSEQAVADWRARSRLLMAPEPAATAVPSPQPASGPPGHAVPLPVAEITRAFEHLRAIRCDRHDGGSTR